MKTKKIEKPIKIYNIIIIKLKIINNLYNNLLYIIK